MLEVLTRRRLPASKNGKIGAKPRFWKTSVRPRLNTLNQHGLELIAVAKIVDPADPEHVSGLGAAEPEIDVRVPGYRRAEIRDHDVLAVVRKSQLRDVVPRHQLTGIGILAGARLHRVNDEALDLHDVTFKPGLDLDVACHQIPRPSRYAQPPSVTLTCLDVL